MSQTVKNPLQCRRPRFDPWVGKMPWRREWPSIPVFLPGEFHGQDSSCPFSAFSTPGETNAQVREFVS